MLQQNKVFDYVLAHIDDVKKTAWEGWMSTAFLSKCVEWLQSQYENGNKEVEKFMNDNNITSAVWAYMYF